MQSEVGNQGNNTWQGGKKRGGKRRKEKKRGKEWRSKWQDETRRGSWNAITLIVIAQRVRRIELGIGATKRAIEEKGGGKEKGNERDWLVFVIPRAEESSRGRVHATIMGRSWLSYSPSTVERNFLNVDRTTTYIVGDKLKLFRNCLIRLSVCTYFSLFVYLSFVNIEMIRNLFFLENFV